MDRVDRQKPRPRSPYASEGDFSERDRGSLDSATGRENHLGLTKSGATAASEINQPIGAKPQAEITGRHDAGSGANQTRDGLSGTEEAVRRAAETVPPDEPAGYDDDIPVFDRRDEMPKP